MKTKNLVIITFAALIISSVMLINKLRNTNPVVEDTFGVLKTGITWEYSNPTNYYSSNTTTNDIVDDVLKNYSKVTDFVRKEVSSDVNLMRLVNREQTVALSKEQLRIDLEKLKGLDILLIGYHHRSIDSDDNSVEQIQTGIVKIIKDSCDVMWTEDFCDGKIIRSDSAWEELIRESQESSIPNLVSYNDETTTREFMRQETQYYASFQLLFDIYNRVEIRGVDYFPIKAIQQHFIEYELPIAIRGPLPFNFSIDQKQSIASTLSSVRNLYALRHMALYADRTKRHGLVMGIFHVNELTYILVKYGANVRVVMPKL